MSMKIDFEWQTFYEEDDTWEALFVKVNDGTWHLAKAAYNTEDQDDIIKIINSYDM